MGWTESEHNRLAYLARTTKMSASQIGAEIGKSRNAVIGRAMRTGLHLPNHGSKASPRPLTRRVAKGRKRAPVTVNRSFRPPEPVKTEAPAPKPARHVDLLEARDRCLFPIGPASEEPSPDMLCCGALLGDLRSRKGLARSFCDHHVERCRGKR